MNVALISGLGGSLLPSAFMRQLPALEALPADEREHVERTRRDLVGWWRHVDARYGPATGLRTIVDETALPLFAALGYTRQEVVLEHDQAHVVLALGAGTRVAAIVRPWASRRSNAWRDVVRAASRADVRWAFLWAPPFLSLVDASPSTSRRALECAFPDALHADAFARLWTLCAASSLSGLARIVAESHRFQDAVRTDLQRGVVTALRAIERVVARGRGRSETPSFDQALTLVYRLLFLLFAEARDLVPVRHPAYGRSYAIGALCRDAIDGGDASGLWEGLAAITRLSRAGCRTDDLIVRPFNGRLFARASAPALERRRARNAGRALSPEDAAMREALTAIATRTSNAGRVDISYADLGVEQLGAVYERLLDIDATPAQGRPHSARRKETGTFYTPQPLAEFLVRRTLAPLVSGATTDAILALRVVDPAMGSGACLVAACRYLARAYRHALVDEGRCADSDFDADERARIRRLIAERCLAGVDANPVAAQLARLSLWLTTLSRGRPLSFLDHRLRVGNSLIGAAPEDLVRPATARRGRERSFPLFEAAGIETAMQTIARPLFELTTRPDDSVRDVHAKESLWARLTSAASPLEPWRRACDLWCARWFWRGGPSPSAREVREAIASMLGRSSSLKSPVVREWTSIAGTIGAAHAFFHWPLEFGDVFYDEHGRPRDRAGFDAVIGNPPWEMLRRDPLGAGDNAASAGGALVSFIRESGLYPSCDRGHMNLYQPFLERALSLARPGGQVGLVLPWGVCSDDGAAELRRRLFERSRVSTIVGLDNARALFPIHRGLRFAVVVASPGGATDETRLRLGVRTTEEIAALPDVDDPIRPSYPVRLSPRDLAVMSGPELRVPDVRRPGDLELLARLTREFRPAGDASTWGLSFGRELNASDDRDAFGDAGLPVIDGKHVSPFTVDVRRADRRIALDEACRRLPDRRFDRPRLGYRDVSGVGNKLALIAAVVPPRVVTTHTVFCLRTALDVERQHFLCACFNSYVLNAIVRMLMGGHVTTSLVEHLPLPIWRDDEADRRIARLAARLALHPAPPRAHARLQQAVARRYGVGRDEFARILDGFRLVDEADRRLALEGFAL